MRYRFAMLVLRHPQAPLGGATRRRRICDAYGKPTYWEGDYSVELEATGCGNPYYFTGRRIDFVGLVGGGF